MIDATDIYVGLSVGLLPTASMILAALLIYNLKISKTFESTAQNYCAGLILGAVAKELFPQVSSVSKWNNLVGITVGFTIGLAFVNFLDYVVSMVENSFSCATPATTGDDLVIVGSVSSLGGGIQMGSRSPNSAQHYQALESGTNMDFISEGSESGSEADQDHPIVLLASQAIASPMHRERIRKKIVELETSVASMEEKSCYLHKSWKTIPGPASELCADQIDEEIHRFQYNLDHCRRLIQGSGSDIEGVVPRLWITDQGVKNLHEKMSELRRGIGSLHRSLSSDELNRDSLIHIHNEIDQMDNNINQLHQTVENYSFKWGRRGKKRIIPIPKSGSYIPMGLIIPVTVDCIVDGFLVGSTSAISFRAGVILSLANMIEMGFLGLAVSVRIQKCTASSASARMTSLIFPPLVMLLSSGLGAACGASARAHPVVYIGFIAFGIVALLYLVVNELLVEAREALGGEEYWWTAMVLFVGIYSVILLDMVI